MNDIVIAAKADEKSREDFIKDNEQIILRIASRVCGKYLTKNDDEWSVSLLAFNKAIDSYSDNKGEFMAFASLVIKRSLIDHYRFEKRFSPEVLTDDEVLQGNGRYEDDSEVMKAVSRDGRYEYNKIERQISLKEEIVEVNEKLKKYGFSFSDLAGASPKAGKTKTECGKAIRCILDDEKMTSAIVEGGKLPIADIINETGLKRKLLDKYRRYIIMAVIILNGEYPLLADYLEYVRKEGDS